MPHYTQKKSESKEPIRNAKLDNAKRRSLKAEAQTLKVKEREGIFNPQRVTAV